MRLLVFDWDGTLSDSTAKIITAMQLAIGNLKLPAIDDEAVRNIIGLSLPEAITELYPLVSAFDRERLRLAYIDCFVNDHTQTALFPGVLEGLSQLNEAGFTLAVATGKARRGLDKALTDNMAGLFAYSRCADEAHSKPHPQMLYELLEQSGVPADQTLMMGDTEYDMAMAQAAGVHRVAVSYGAHHIDRLKRYTPILSIDHFSYFCHWLLSNEE